MASVVFFAPIRAGVQYFYIYAMYHLRSGAFDQSIRVRVLILITSVQCFNCAMAGDQSEQAKQRDVDKT